MVYSNMLGVVTGKGGIINNINELIKGDNFLRLSDNSLVYKGDENKMFEYSIDNGESWKTYSTRNDVDLPEGCVITNFRIHDIINEKNNKDSSFMIITT